MSNLYDRIKADSNTALKNGDKTRRLVLSDIIASIEKASIQKDSRTAITDTFVGDVLIKYKKTVQEMIDTCPNTEQYITRRAEYQTKLDIVNEYAPKVIDNPEEMKTIIRGAFDLSVLFADKRKNMKEYMSFCKQEGFDMKLANSVLAELEKEYQNG